MKEMDYVVLLYAVGTAHIDMFTFKVNTLCQAFFVLLVSSRLCCSPPTACEERQPAADPIY